MFCQKVEEFKWFLITFIAGLGVGVRYTTASFCTCNFVRLKISGFFFCQMVEELHETENKSTISENNTHTQVGRFKLLTS